MAKRTINIAFPFEQSAVGDFLLMNATTEKAIKSDLVHLLLTRKGDRLYNPEFGSGLYDYIFEQIDETTLADVKRDLEVRIKRYIPNLTVDEIIVTPDPDKNQMKINFEYTITQDAFEESDSIEIIL
tara:strand:+ start:840 stop:1220 length:381 start_codon:yes stop_codon:yes gene_type:complete